MVAIAGEKARWNGRALTGRGIPTQDLRIGTLYAARKDSVPFADLLRRVKLERVRLKRSQLSNQRCRLLGHIAMPLKGSHPTPAPSVPSRGPAGARLLALVLLPTTGATPSPPRTRGA